MVAKKHGLRLDLSENPYPPISDYAMISDCHSAALVSCDGSIDWCAFHRFDARPVFARILDWRKGGHFQIVPYGEYESSRRYLPATNVLETTFRTQSGVIRVTDCIPMRVDEGPKTLGAHATHQLIRLVRCDEGRVTVTMDCAPRFDFGLTVPRLELHSNTEGIVFGGSDALTIQAGVPLEQKDLSGCVSTFDLEAGGTTWVTIRHDVPHYVRLEPVDETKLTKQLEETVRFWEEWCAKSTYEGPYEAEVQRSALVLKGLTNAPSGAIVAAATTSLPEAIGGPRNWDYRYTWLRDSALHLYALFGLGYTQEAEDFMGWVRRTSAGMAEDLQTMYGVGGERFLPEIELNELEGYRGSAPVRIGNAAAKQLQLDIYGELLDTAWLYYKNGGVIDETFWYFLRDAIDVVERRWSEPDEGMWEVRGGRIHFVSSKFMCWVAVDRAIKLAQRAGLPCDHDRWVGLRRQIRKSVEENGVNPKTGALRRSYGSEEVDASNLLAPMVGFLRPDDPRVKANLEEIAATLTKNGLVYRYKTDDGLPTDEGAFVICSFWLVDNFAMAGELDRATELFEQLLSYSNDCGLLAEQVDPETGEQLGNFPQAFSHLGLIGAAMNLDKARENTSKIAPSGS